MEATKMQCSNCETKITPLWRRSINGSYLCNACGLYFKIHHISRPRELKTETFRHRQRIRRNEDFEDFNNECLHGQNNRYQYSNDPHGYSYFTDDFNDNQVSIKKIYRKMYQKQLLVSELETVAAEALLQLRKDGLWRNK